MRFLFIAFLISTFFAAGSFAQWNQQNSGTNSNLFFIQSIDENTGWAVGYSLQNYKLFKTTNGGVSWIDYGILLPGGGMLQAIYFFNSSTGWLASYGFNEVAKIHKTTDGGVTWLELAGSYPYFGFGEFKFTDPLTGYVVGSGQLGTGAVFKTTDGGVNWSPVLGTMWSLLSHSLDFVDNNTGWIAGGNILKTTDGGISWQEQLNIEPDVFTSIQFVSHMIGWACNSYDSKIYKTTNGGASWFQQSQVGFNKVYFTDSSNGWLINNSQIYYTGDGGDNWLLQNSNSTEGLNDIFFINRFVGWAVGSNGTILHTINGGTPVELVSFTAQADANNIILNWQTATENNNSGFGIERSDISSESTEWQQIGFISGQGTTTQPSYYFYEDKGLVPGKYHYRLKQIDFDGSFTYSTEIESEITNPSGFTLGQNYPNPFNPATNINFSISVDSKVSLIIFDILGQEVGNVINGTFAAGFHKVNFNASNLNSGIYFYRISATGMDGSNFSAVKKMIFTK